MDCSPRLTLTLLDGEIPSLESTCFELRGETRIAVRGRTAGAFRGLLSFRLTAAVQAMTALLLAAKAEAGVLSGEEGSPAATLDYALSKQPLWLLDMFGLDQAGNAAARRIFLRSNPERKRPGPVVLALNERYLPSERIQVLLNGQKVTDAAELRRLAAPLAPSRPASQTNALVASGSSEMSLT